MQKEQKEELKIKVIIPWWKRIKYSLITFFRVLSGGQYCENCKLFFDYECEYCYTHKPHWYSRKTQTKFVPLERNKHLKNRFIAALEAFKKEGK